MSDFANVLQTIARMSDAERQDLLVYLQRSGEFSFPTDRVEEPRPAYGAALKYMTREEFFEFQEQSAITYEYINGIIRAMSGPTVAHSIVTRNIFRIVDARIRGGSCEAFWGVQLNLTLDNDEIVYEPDLYVSCDRSAWDKKWIPNPRFVLEVLSPSTQRIDRCEKLVNYRRAPSVEEYVIASQKRAELEIYRRADGWRLEVVKGVGAVAEFRSLDVSAPLKEIYEGVPIGVAEPSAVQAVDPPPYMTEEEYLEFEENSPMRHEYVNGAVYAMNGASLAHNRIVSRLHFALRRRLRGGPCEVFIQDLKLKLAPGSDKFWYYPDLMVSCDRAGWYEKWVTNPRLVIEVLSASTKHIDRREKATTYRRIDTIDEYVIVAQHSRQLTIQRREANWVPQVVSGPEAIAEFRSLSASVPLAEIYENIFE